MNAIIFLRIIKKIQINLLIIKFAIFILDYQELFKIMFDIFKFQIRNEIYRNHSNMYYSSNLEEMEIVVINQYNSMILANITGTNNNNNICYEIINILVL